MYQTRSGYDRGVNTFSPEGRLFQVEYADKAIELGSCSVGVKTPHGVVLAVEKRVFSPLLEPSSIEKIFEIDSHIGAAASGLTADARTLIEHARVESQNHRFTYDEPMKVETVTQIVCDLSLSFGEGGKENKSKMSRPFGVALLIGGFDLRGPVLFHTEPSGTFTQYDAHAIGNGSEGAIALLQEKYNTNMTLEAAMALATRVMASTMEEKLHATNFELVTITPNRGYRVATADELQPLIDRALAEAAAEAI